MMEEQFKSLKLISECPVCRTKQFPADIRLIEEQASGHLLHIQCKNCKSCIVVLVSVGEQSINLIGILTDLGSEEVGKYLQRGPLSADDIIGLHEKLRDEDFIKQIIE